MKPSQQQAQPYRKVLAAVLVLLALAAGYWGYHRAVPPARISQVAPAPNPDFLPCQAANSAETAAAADVTLAACGRVIADKSSTPATLAAARAAGGRAYLAKASADITARDFPHALQDATAALPSGDPAAHLYRGEAEDAAGDYPAALTDESADIAAHANAWQAHYWRGLAEEHLNGKLAAAGGDLTASSKLNSAYAPAFAELGLVAFKQNALPDALYDESQALALFAAQQPSPDPDYPQANCLALTTRATAELRLSNFAGTKADAQAAIALNVPGPWRALAFKDLGYVELKSADYAGAVSALTQAQALSPKDKDVAQWLAAAQQGPRTRR